MICPKCGKETNGTTCPGCGLDLRGGWQIFDLPELNDGFFNEQPAGDEQSAGRFSLPPDSAGGGFTISLPQEAVSPAEPAAAEPEIRPEPPVQRPRSEAPTRPQAAKPAPRPAEPEPQPAQTVPQGFFLVPEPEKTLWGNFKRAVYKLLDYKGLMPALLLLIFVMGLALGWLLSHSGGDEVQQPEPAVTAAGSSAAESSQAPTTAALQKTEEDPELKQYFAETLLPEYDYLPNGQDVSAYDASGIISAVNDGGQLTVFRITEGDLQIDAYGKEGGQTERIRGTTSREFLKRVYDADGTVTVTADSKGIYLDGRQIWKHGLGASLTSPVTICTCMKRQDADRWDRAAYLFADSTNIRTAVPASAAPEEESQREPEEESQTEPAEPAEPEQPAEPEPENAADILSLYGEKLREQLAAIQEMNNPDWDAQFALCYVDDDDIPELLLDVQQTGSGYDYFSIYVIADDAVVRLETGGGINQLSVSERTNHVYEYGYRAPDYADYCFEYHIDGTELVRDYSRWIAAGDGRCFINGAEVSTEEYRTETARYVSPHEMKEPVWYHLDEQNITEQCG